MLDGVTSSNSGRLRLAKKCYTDLAPSQIQSPRTVNIVITLILSIHTLDIGMLDIISWLSRGDMTTGYSFVLIIIRIINIYTQIDLHDVILMVCG